MKIYNLEINDAKTKQTIARTTLETSGDWVEPLGVYARDVIIPNLTGFSVLYACDCIKKGLSDAATETNINADSPFIYCIDAYGFEFEIRVFLETKKVRSEEYTGNVFYLMNRTTRPTA